MKFSSLLSQFVAQSIQSARLFVHSIWNKYREARKGNVDFYDVFGVNFNYDRKILNARLKTTKSFYSQI
jgi:hypothetical protein